MNTVQIPKDKIPEMLQQQGNSDPVDQAKQELPDRLARPRRRSTDL